VVGAGITGLAAALELSDRGADVRVFEAARPGAGQSAGVTRLFRHSHADPAMVRLAVESRSLWDRWSERFGRPLVGPEGVVVTGPEVDAHAVRLRDAGAPCRLLDGVAEELPALAAASAGPALFDERGGPIDVRAAIDALAGALSGSIVPGRVFRLEPRERSVRVESSEGIVEVGRAIVCAGAEVRELLPDTRVSVGCHLRGTFRARNELRGRSLACLQDQSGAHGETAYGAPVPGEDLYAVGLSGAYNEVPEDPSAREPGRNATIADLERRLRAYVGRALPGLDPEPAALRLCLTTILPAGPDNLELRREGPLTTVLGDNLFKFAPLLGRMLAD